MFSDIKIKWNKQRIQQLTDVRNIMLYIFALIVLAIAWDCVKTVQSNYELQKKIAQLQQENTIIQLTNENTNLQNQYLNTDQYQELTARRSLGLAAPGEQVLIVPQEVALKYISPEVKAQITQTSKPQSSEPKSKYARNLEAWRNFLLGRKIYQD